MRACLVWAEAAQLGGTSGGARGSCGLAMVRRKRRADHGRLRRARAARFQTAASNGGGVRSSRDQVNHARQSGSRPAAACGRACAGCSARRDGGAFGIWRGTGQAEESVEAAALDVLLADIDCTDTGRHRFVKEADQSCLRGDRPTRCEA